MTVPSPTPGQGQVGRYSSAVDDLSIALSWLRHVAAARAGQQVSVPGGVGLLHRDFPAAHDHNRLLLWSPVDAGAAAASAESVLGGAGLSHRLIDVHGEGLADSLDNGLRGRGYERSNELIMAYRGAGPPAVPRASVAELDLTERTAAASADWRTEHPEWGERVTTQLGERIRTVLAAAEATFLAVRDDRGNVVSRADLYLRAGVAQIEDVNTLPAARGRGYAFALVEAARTRARNAGADPIFLVADADDWPADWYRRLGFTEIGRSASYAR